MSHHVALKAGRRRFKQWVGSSGVQSGTTIRYSCCIQVDAASLDSIIRGPQPPARDIRKKAWVNVIDIQSKLPNTECEDEGEVEIDGCTLYDVGWMKVGVGSLARWAYAVLDRVGWREAISDYRPWYSSERETELRTSILFETATPIPVGSIFTQLDPGPPFDFDVLQAPALSREYRLNLPSHDSITMTLLFFLLQAATYLLTLQSIQSSLHISPNITFDMQCSSPASLFSAQVIPKPCYTLTSVLTSI